MRKISARRSLPLVAMLLLVSAAFPFSRPTAANNRVQAIPDQYIVVFKDSVSDPVGKARGLANARGLSLLYTYEHALKGFAGVVPASQLDALKADPDVAYIQQDEVVSLGDFVAQARPGGSPAKQTLPTGIDRIDGELSDTVSGNGSGSVDVDVAVIDTGIDIDHPDLNVVGGKNCSTGASYDDGNGHGTHVAGTIAAKDDASGVVGVAPGARLWAVRVLNHAGSGSWSSVACGVDWVTENAGTIEVANMSLGGSGSEPSEGGCSTGDALHDAICTSVGAGVTYAVAAGNSSADAEGFVPAAYDEVITVSALADFDGKSGGLGSPTCRDDEDDTFANFSNFGADVDIIAPGVCINSTWKGGGYNTISGTSMASPHVAGAAALYKASNSTASPEQVKTALQNAGTTDWTNSDDNDGTKEKLLNVDAF
ncbi:MAG TPA: S8 family peptidase [Herpetosiphonaceae bacterium]|nr:S8 family peptidase [Herpetosiphonaceae bacterium]